jgi:hypothetical protein
LADDKTAPRRRPQWPNSPLHARTNRRTQPTTTRRSLPPACRSAAPRPAKVFSVSLRLTAIQTFRLFTHVDNQKYNIPFSESPLFLPSFPPTATPVSVNLATFLHDRFFVVTTRRFSCRPPRCTVALILSSLSSSKASSLLSVATHGGPRGGRDEDAAGCRLAP